MWHKCSTPEPTFTINFTEVKVKVQGHNRRTENLLVIARPSFKISIPNLSDRSKFGMTYATIVW